VEGFLVETPSRRNILKYAVTAIVAGVVAGVGAGLGGYNAGRVEAENLKEKLFTA